MKAYPLFSPLGFLNRSIYSISPKGSNSYSFILITYFLQIIFSQVLQFIHHIRHVYFLVQLVLLIVLVLLHLVHLQLFSGCSSSILLSLRWYYFAWEVFYFLSTQCHALQCCILFIKLHIRNAFRLPSLFVPDDTNVPDLANLSLLYST